MSRLLQSLLLVSFGFVAPLWGQATTPKTDAPKPTTIPDVEKALDQFRQQKFNEALETLNKAYKANPTLIPPRVLLAQWFLQANSGQNARVQLEQAITEDPGHPDAYLLNASFALGEGRITDAILNLTIAQDLGTNTRWDTEQKKRFERESRMGLAQCYQLRNDFDKASGHLQGLLNSDPKNGPLRARYAEVVFRSGKPEEALRELKTAYADDPTLDPPELRMAGFWQFQSSTHQDVTKGEADRKKAEGYFQAACTAYPKNAKCKRDYAVWLMEDGRADAAKTYVDAAAAQDPDSRDTLAVRALLHLYKKEFAAAEPLLQKILSNAPGDAFAQGHLCYSLVESGDKQKIELAIKHATALVQANQKAAVGHAILGWCYYKAGRIDEADRTLGTALSGGQVSFDTAYFLARLFNDKQKYEEAHRLLKESLNAPHGPFVYRTDAKALLSEVAKKVPEKKDEPKKH